VLIFTSGGLFLFLLLCFILSIRSTFTGNYEIFITEKQMPVPSAGLTALSPLGRQILVRQDSCCFKLSGFYKSVILSFADSCMQDDLLVAARRDHSPDKLITVELRRIHPALSAGTGAIYFEIPPDAFIHQSAAYRFLYILYSLLLSWWLPVLFLFFAFLLINGYIYYKRLRKTTDFVLTDSEGRALQLRKKSEGLKLLCLLLFIVAFFTRVPLLDKEYRYAFEADSDVMLHETHAFGKFINAPYPENFPGPMGAVTYFDGPFILYALHANLLSFVSPLDASGTLQPGSNSLMIFSTRWTNLLAYCFSLVFSFLLLYKLSRKKWPSMLMTVFALLFADQFLEVDFMRIDHLLLLWCVAQLYVAIQLIEKPGHRASWIAFALVSALSAATKAYIVIAVTVPVTLLVLYFTRRTARAYSLKVFVPVFLLSLTVLFVRWMVYPGHLADFFQMIGGFGKQWYASTSAAGMYYHIDSFVIHAADMTGGEGFKGRPGLLQMIMSGPLATNSAVFAVSAMLAWALLIFRSVKRREPALIILSAVFIIYSSGLISGPKTGRFGILMPFFYAVSLLMLFYDDPPPLRKKLAAALLRICIFLFFVSLMIAWTADLRNAARRNQAFEQVRMQPAQWMNDHIRKQSRIKTYTRDRLSYPPVFDLEYDFTPLPLNSVSGTLPDTALLRMSPPHRSELFSGCDLLLVTNNQRDHHYYLLALLSSGETMWFFREEMLTVFLKQIREDNVCRPYQKLLFENQDLLIENTLGRMWHAGCDFNEAASYSLRAAGADTLAAGKIAAHAAASYGLIGYDYAGLLSKTGGKVMKIAWKRFFTDVRKHSRMLVFRSRYAHYFLSEVNIYILNPDVYH
jgi:hypothetical protein